MNFNINRIEPKDRKPKARIKDFNEVTYSYSQEEAVKEASRCLNCAVPKCRISCPVNIDIPKFIQAIKNKDFLLSWEIIKQKNSMPCITGRICPQEIQCEGSCILKNKKNEIAIGNLEKFVADYAAKQKLENAKINKNVKIAIIGSGPAGLQCASDCIKNGYEVVVFEALHDIGGVLRYGIPNFRLPKNVLDKEIKDLKKLGVKFEVNAAIGYTLQLEDLKKIGFKAFFIAIGAGVPYFLNIEGENLRNIYSANEFLTRINLLNANQFCKYDTPVNFGKKAVVIGGGNVAMDSARTLLRLGVSDVTVVYRRTKTEMPAREAEILHAEEEGIKFQFLKEPIKFLDSGKGEVKGLKLQDMELMDELDVKNRKRVRKIENSFANLLADTIVVAIGQSTNYFLAEKIGIKLDDKKHIIVDKDSMQTNIEGIFAGGDVITGADTVISAMGAGKKAAKSIDDYLMKK
ncbi:MAG: NADPH-dependent glutamate synthase [Elusimicrobiota bacterium]|jgi:glutamate synthase (NADPH/NADH) small chain|nr:NADPH-dependent glutamate synthase [Elusimicrobiota bacterium]